ncbi:chemotaxis-specific protein-glutamate methyltransferase CheB [Sphingomonas sp. RIT328]|uniref:chemotaxis-specific protein-glutamate methyltransferase CheB n=1 Tax=Sphingomonas sp. RIT328 TaxID=1470591 RepID=UPI00044602B6|nr:chemotaxis-specific protein-glutamate methyltransferase CheB [Sphingomonas sp. RIT328]EZP57166.1 Response regulator [Sphingomonas sp. RIT328]
MATAIPLDRQEAATAGATPARVLIVDDSAVARAVVERILTATDRYAVVASVSTAAAALDVLARAKVDVILLDVQMPGTDGLTALPDLIVAGAGATVLVVSGQAGEGAATTVQALALGAADTVFKPASGARLGQFAAILIDKLDRLAGATPSRMPSPPAPARPAPPPRIATGAGSDEFDIVAIGASTGGIHALSAFLAEIPASFRLPILITQHLPTAFMPYFAAQLALIGKRPCEVATDRLRLRPGRIVVAPGDAHMRIVALADGSAAIRLTAEPVASGCTPSVDPMFASLAAVFGPRLLAVVLSGMGRDGSDGARRVHEAGGCVVVQDQASSVIWGMPGAVVDGGSADAVLPPAAIGRIAAARRRP